MSATTDTTTPRPRRVLEVVDNLGRSCGHIHYSHRSAVHCRRLLIRKWPGLQFALRGRDDERS